MRCDGKLTAAEVIAKGGWHRRYARVIALASDDDYGFALVAVGAHGIWAFIAVRPGRPGGDAPALAD